MNPHVRYFTRLYTACCSCFLSKHLGFISMNTRRLFIRSRQAKRCVLIVIRSLWYLTKISAMLPRYLSKVNTLWSSYHTFSRILIIVAPYDMTSYDNTTIYPCICNNNSILIYLYMSRIYVLFLLLEFLYDADLYSIFTPFRSRRISFCHTTITRRCQDPRLSLIWY